MTFSVVGAFSTVNILYLFRAALTCWRNTGLSGALQPLLQWTLSCPFSYPGPSLILQVGAWSHASVITSQQTQIHMVPHNHLGLHFQGIPYLLLVLQALGMQNWNRHICRPCAYAVKIINLIMGPHYRCLSLNYYSVPIVCAMVKKPTDSFIFTSSFSTGPLRHSVTP